MKIILEIKLLFEKKKKLKIYMFLILILFINNIYYGFYIILKLYYFMVLNLNR